MIPQTEFSDHQSTSRSHFGSVVVSVCMCEYSPTGTMTLGRAGHRTESCPHPVPSLLGRQARLAPARSPVVNQSVSASQRYVSACVSVCVWVENGTFLATAFRRSNGPPVCTAQARCFVAKLLPRRESCIGIVPRRVGRQSRGSEGQRSLTCG